VTSPATRPRGGELRQAGADVQRPEPRRRSAHELAARPTVHDGNGLEERVVIPERGPRDDDEQETDLEEVRGEEQASQQISLRCPPRRA
jgi:hypothetical protein